MGNAAQYLGAGLLKGFGSGLEKVAGMRYERERAAAEDMRQRSLAEFRQGLDDASYKKRTDAEHTYQEGIADKNQTYAEGNVDQWIDSVDKDGNPIKVPVNKRGTTLDGTMARPKTSAEVAAEKAVGVAAGKYDNPLYVAGNKLLDQSFETAVYNRIKGSNDPNYAIDKFQSRGISGMEFNAAQAASAFPDLKQEYDTKRYLMVERMKAGETNPQAAIMYANSKYDSMSEEAKKTANEKRLKDLAKDTNIPFARVKAYSEFDTSPENLKKRAAKYDVKNPDDIKELKELKKVNILAFEAMNKELRKLGISTDLDESTSDNTPTHTVTSVNISHDTTGRGVSSLAQAQQNTGGLNLNDYAIKSKQQDIAAGAAAYMAQLKGKTSDQQQQMLSDWRKSGRLLKTVDAYIQQQLNSPSNVAKNGIL